MVNKENDLISVIVPIYNTEKFLRKCIDSIVNQTYKNLEIILVNDGSPDNAKEICKEYAEKDKRIVYIEQENGGPSRARNVGLDVARGKYIGFVDSDDSIDVTMYEKLYSFLTKNRCDLVECYSVTEKNYYSHYIDKVISGKEATEGFLLRGRDKDFLIIPAVWSKLFSTNLLKQNRFPEGQVHEDYFFTCRCLYEAKRVGVLNEKLVYHIENEDSITHQKFSNKTLNILREYIKIEQYLKEHGEKLLAEYSRVNMLVFAVFFYFKARVAGDVDLTLIKKVLDESKTIKFKRYMNVKSRMMYRLYSINEDLAYNIFKIYKFVLTIIR